MINNFLGHALSFTLKLLYTVVMIAGIGFLFGVALALICLILAGIGKAITSLVQSIREDREEEARLAAQELLLEDKKNY